MLRLVVGPQQHIYFDMKQKLPGECVYILNSKQILQAAINEKAIESIFGNVSVSPDLPDQVEANYLTLMLSIISLAKKSGNILLGKRQIEEYTTAIAKNAANNKNLKAIIVQAIDASASEKFKQGNITILEFFSRDQLSKACGKENLVYVVIQGRFATWLENIMTKYQIYMGN